ncbi:cytochrome P450 302a1, mitochondrial [Chelonus insularis]|uniref:cytochrome P450 302a1, mitochondrial n=1 Tax=Chelonus insularis TaxID=460826 RepID=UPI00158D9B03|nr:cytochrome P450 302a1, mitochondrial [Chelonus insularis]XP_034943809.1 cytochrome P450 302a1, mitochondrial [Chelonus insularis]
MFSYHMYVIRTTTCRYSTTGFTSKPRPFKEIPGPKSLPLIGTLYKYLPFIGEYDFNKLHKTGAKKLSQYGPLVREEIVPGVNTVWVFRPEDIAEIFKAEIGKYPERRSHLALLKYRKDRSHVYNTGGLLPTNGPQWYKLRKEFQKALSKPQNITNYIEKIDSVIKQFIKVCGEKEHEDLLPLLSRLFLEITCLVAFDATIDSFSPEEMQENSRSSRLIDAALTSNSVILKLDNGPQLWRFFETPMYKKLSSSQQYMEKFAVEMVNLKVKQMKERSNKDNASLLELYLQNGDVDTKDVVGMACDMLLAGIDTTTYSIAYALYHLARNIESQKKLQTEAATLLPDQNDPITSATLRHATYVKAVIKETFRLNPISVGVGRILKDDLVLNGYHIPAGTVVVTQNQVICRLTEYFFNPNAFIPERWLRGNIEKPSQGTHPYLVLPFGHGPRSCIARRLAEQNIQMLLLRICRKYNFIWKGKEIDNVSLLINKPDSPINIKFTSLN